jgi:hypothetical protein
MRARTLFAAGSWVGRTGLAAAIGLLAAQAAPGADFTVTTPNNQFSYVINGVSSDPTITLIRGHTYTFAVSTSSDHPFAIGTSVGGPPPAGVSGDNGSISGTITFNVPTNAVDCFYYCTVHFFKGQIKMIDAPSPPVVKLVGLAVGTNVVLTATQSTTNGFSFIPQASTNLATTNWFALTVQSSSFANGTNEIICGRPPGNAAFFRILIQ